MHEAPGEPLAIGVLGGERRLDLVVADDAAGGCVDEEHLARLQTALFDDRSRVEIEHANFGGENDEPVVGHPVAGRAQAVAVEDSSHDGAVGERDGGRAVPGLHQRGVEPVKGPTCGVHLGVVLPRLGNHHEHRVRQRPAREVQELEHLVKCG